MAINGDIYTAIDTVNGHVEVPGFGHEKSPPGMAVRALAAGHLLEFEPPSSGTNRLM